MKRKPTDTKPPRVESRKDLSSDGREVLVFTRGSKGEQRRPHLDSDLGKLACLKVHADVPMMRALRATGNQGGKAEHSERLNFICDLYLTLVERSLPTIGLTRGEWLITLAAHNGIQINGPSAEVIAANIAMVDPIDLKDTRLSHTETAAIDPLALAARVEAFSLTQKIAICEAVKRFFSRDHATVDEGLAFAAIRPTIWKNAP